MQNQESRSELVERLSRIPYTGAISDIMDEMGLHDQTLPQQIQSIAPGDVLAGRALTLLGEPTDSEDPNVIFVPYLRMLGEVKSGDVLISQPNDDKAAHLGELSSETAQYRGATGAVIDGGVRDTSYIQRIGFPVFAKYRTPRDIVGRWRLVDFKTRITIGNVEIHPGDYVVGDGDGVVILPQEPAEEIVTRAEEVVQTENMVRKEILQGVHPVEAFEKYGRF